jgi:hypothetical protein
LDAGRGGIHAALTLSLYELINHIALHRRATVT